MSDKSPDAFRTISEVADWLGVQPHVLRFWESKFSQVRPVKRAGGRRYYRPNDMLLLGGIRKLLHEDGLTIKGAQKVLREEGMSHVARLSQPLDPESAALSEMAVSYEQSAAEEPPGSTPDAPETGQLVDFDAARTSEPERAQSAQAEPSRADPGLAEDSTAPPAAELAKSSSDLPDGDDRTSGREEAAAEAEKGARPASDRLPSFLRPPPAQPGLFDSEAADGSSGEQADDGEDTAESGVGPTAPTAPRPRIVDAPDPDESAFEVRAGALSASHSATALSDRQRAEILPLISQLAALRDRMAAGRGR